MKGGGLEPERLTCPRCGASYLKGVTICYFCGAPLGEAEQPTQPVNVPIHLRARVTAFPGMAAGATAQPASSTPDKPSRERGRALVRPFTVALLALSIVALIAGIVVLHYRLIPPGVPALRIYRDPAHRFHVAQPALWDAHPDDSGVVFSDSAGISTVQIKVMPAAPDEDAEQAADIIAKASGFSYDSPVLQAGATWQRRSGQITEADGTQREVVVLVALHGEQLYLIECSSPASSFETIDGLVLQPLLRSFAFD
jgi:hypothetical protein